MVAGPASRGPVYTRVLAYTRGLTGRAHIAAVLVFAGTCAFRFIGVGLTNDDLLFFAIGRQIAAFGEWPVRDLFEEGDPLHNIISAGLQALTGHSLAGEVLFDILMLALAAALVTDFATRLLRSVWGGTLAAVLTVIAGSRLYDYPKALIPAVALLLCLRYQERPTSAGAAILGVTTGVVFLLRHDFGAYVAAATLVALCVTGASRRMTLRPALFTWLLAVAVIAGPYLLYVQSRIGLAAYVEGARRFTQREVSRSDDPPPSFAVDWSQPLWRTHSERPIKIRWREGVTAEQRTEAEQRYSLADARDPEGRTWSYLVRDTSPTNLAAIVRDPLIEDTANIDRLAARGPESATPSALTRVLEADVAMAPGILTRRNAVAWLYDAYRVLPLLAFVLAVTGLVRSGWMDARIVAMCPALIFCLVSAPLLLRGNMYENSRISDLTTPVLLLTAALLPVVWQVSAGRRQRAIRVATVVVLSITTIAICSYAMVARNATAIVMLADEGRLGEEASRLWAWLLASPPRLDDVPREGGVRGAVEYLEQCSAPADRILVFGFYPDMLFYSGRGTAADRVVLLRGFGVMPDEEQRTLDAMNRHPASVAIVEVTAGTGSVAGRVLDGLHPMVERYLADRYSRAATTTFGGSTGATFDLWINKTRQVTRPGPFGLPCA